MTAAKLDCPGCDGQGMNKVDEGEYDFFGGPCRVCGGDEEWDIEEEPTTIREALLEVRDALTNLPADVFGVANADDPDPGATRWYVRDELLARVDAALKDNP